MDFILLFFKNAQLFFKDALPFFQFLFYAVVGFITILTYRRARKTLLNSVNIEYQKTIIQRLREISNEISSWFDPASEIYWLDKENIRQKGYTIQDYYKNDAEKVLNHKKVWEISETYRSKHIINRLKLYESDPFIPSRIRDLIIDQLLLDIEKVFEIEKNAVLEHSRYWREKEGDEYSKEGSLYIRFKELLDEDNIDIDDIEERMHVIRKAIQNHYSKYDPFK